MSMARDTRMCEGSSNETAVSSKNHIINGRAHGRCAVPLCDPSSEVPRPFFSAYFFRWYSSPSSAHSPEAEVQASISLLIKKATPPIFSTILLAVQGYSTYIMELI